MGLLLLPPVAQPDVGFASNTALAVLRLHNVVNDACDCSAFFVAASVRHDVSHIGVQPSVDFGLNPLLL